MHFSILTSRVLPENLTIKIYRTLSVSVVLYGRETWLSYSEGKTRIDGE